jgi:hypothetical protein
MEITSLEREAPEPLFNPASIIVAVLGTLIVTMNVLDRWAAFEATDKFLAVCLLISLVAYPALAFWKERAGKRVRRDKLVTTAYVWLMGATILFSHLHR